MTSTTLRSTDRVQAFLAAIDIHEPTLLEQNEDLFRIFARHLSRSLDGRYLDRHPPQELIPAIEELLSTSLFREADEIKVSLLIPCDLAIRLIVSPSRTWYSLSSVFLVCF